MCYGPCFWRATSGRSSCKTARRSWLRPDCCSHSPQKSRASAWNEGLTVSTLQRILLLCRKELMLALKVRRSRMVLIVPAILQTLVFGYAATFDLDDVPYAVLDEDHG